MKKSFFSIPRFPFFYGNIIIFSGIIGILASTPGQTIGVSVFTDFLIRDLGISRENLSIAYMFGTLMSSFVIIYVGRFFDKFGARVTSVIAGAMLGLSLFYLSAVENIVGFLNDIFGVAFSETITFIVLVLGFFLIRFFGQGSLTMSSRNMVMKWYEKRRGMASAVMGIAISFGFSYAPKFFDTLISAYSWQVTWQILAVGIGIIFALYAFFTFRDNPQGFGLIPDGKEIVQKKKDGIKYKANKDYTLKEAKRSLSFWVFNLTLTVQVLYITALTFHVVDIFNAAGMDRSEAINIFLPSSIVAVTFQLVSGYLADFIKLKYLLFVQLIGMIISMTGLYFLAAGFPIVLIIVGNGVASGLYGVVSSVTWPRYYGTKHLGEISGFNMSWIVAGSAIGPYLFSLLKDFSGSYELSGLVMLIITMVLFILTFKADNVNLAKPE
ncbi:MAG: MFS transporter [Bacteroidetes bacterium]|nr:MFS transporter [Bacteroidota bacterium]